MTKAQKMALRLRHTWARTNKGNCDVMEQVLKIASSMINDGALDSELVEAYLVISETFKIEFKKD